jgi:hypothetical protein
MHFGADSMVGETALSLPLLVLWIAAANDPHHTPATDHFAVFTNRFYAASNLHFSCLYVRF